MRDRFSTFVLFSLILKCNKKILPFTILASIHFLIQTEYTDFLKISDDLNYFKNANKVLKTLLKYRSSSRKVCGGVIFLFLYLQLQLFTVTVSLIHYTKNEVFH